MGWPQDGALQSLRAISLRGCPLCHSHIPGCVCGLVPQIKAGCQPRPPSQNHKPCPLGRVGTSDFIPPVGCWPGSSALGMPVGLAPG